jgi:hypothetical protein
MAQMQKHIGYWIAGCLLVVGVVVMIAGVVALP